jgi:hypothetical protein
MRIEAGVGDLVRRIEDDKAQVGYLMVGRSGSRVTMCAIRIRHMKEKRRPVSRFSLKIGGDGLSVV